MLHIMYGNDRTNYRLIAKSADISDAMEEKLYKAYKSYYIPTDTTFYSDRRYYPKSICYLVSDLDRMLKKKQIIYCLNAQMDNIKTPCTYFHGIILDEEKPFFQNQFDMLFHIQFVRAENLMEYDGGDPGKYKIDVPPLEIVKEITEEQMCAALQNFYENELKKRETRWILDVQGDAFNARGIQLLAAFYRILPWQNRKSCGFITYCDERQNVSDRIRIRIYDRTQLHSVKGYFDWGNIRKENISREVREYVGFLLNASKEEKSEFETELEQLFGSEEVSAAWAAEYYAISRVWERDEPSKAFFNWKSFLLKYKWEKNRLYEFLLKKMEKRLSNEVFNGLLLSELMQMDCIYSKIPYKISTIFEMAELLPWIRLDEEKLCDWELEQLKKGHKEKSLVGMLETEIHQLKQKPPQGEKQNHLRDILIQRLQGEVDAFAVPFTASAENFPSEEEDKNIGEKSEPQYVEGQKAEAIALDLSDEEREAQEIQRRVNELLGKEIYELKRCLNDISDHMRYRGNISTYINAWCELFEKKCAVLDWFRSEQEYEEWMQWLDGVRVNLGGEKYHQYSDKLKEKRKYLDEFRESRNIRIQEYRELQEYYRAYWQRKYAEDIIGCQKDQNFLVSFADGGSYKLDPEDMKDLVCYLLYYDGVMPEALFLSHSSLVHSLLSSRLFRPEHFRDLMTSGINIKDKCAIMEYFMGMKSPGISSYDLDIVMKYLERKDKNLYTDFQKYCVEKKSSPIDFPKKIFGNKTNKRRG